MGGEEFLHPEGLESGRLGREIEEREEFATVYILRDNCALFVVAEKGLRVASIALSRKSVCIREKGKRLLVVCELG